MSLATALVLTWDQVTKLYLEPERERERQKRPPKAGDVTRAAFVGALADLDPTLTADELEAAWQKSHTGGV